MGDERRATLSPDTSPEAERLQVQGLRQRYPADTPAVRRRRLADLLLGPELAARAYGPFQDGDGC